MPRLQVSTNLLHWSKPTIIFDNGPESQNGRLWEWHGGITPFNYGDLNPGFLERRPNEGFGATCELVCQREGQSWRRVASGTPFLDIGPEGAFDRGLIYPTHNPPIRLGDQLLVFYTAAQRLSAEDRPALNRTPTEARVHPAEQAGAGGVSQKPGRLTTFRGFEF